MYICTVCLAGYLSVTNYRKIKETRLKKKKKKKKKDVLYQNCTNGSTQLNKRFARALDEKCL